ncbi:MAG: hypothetical protein WBL47_05000 [Bacilli bacterium]
MDRKKLTTIILIAFAVVVVFVIGAFTVHLFTNSKTYKCYHYEEAFSYANEDDAQIVDHIPNYKYLKLELKKDKTFKMKLAVKDGSGVTEIVGTYSDKNDKITLNFVGQHVEFQVFDSLEFTRAGRELRCRQTATKTIGDTEVTITITLKFKKTIF